MTYDGREKWGESQLRILNPSLVQTLWQEEHCATRRIIFTYPMVILCCADLVTHLHAIKVAYTDMEEAAKTEVMEIATNACEKYLNDNQSVIHGHETSESGLLIPSSGGSNDQRSIRQEIWDHLACGGGWRVRFWYILRDFKTLLHVLCWKFGSLCLEVLQLLAIFIAGDSLLDTMSALI